MRLEAESYLKSGSNEVRILEYRLGGRSFGINILKVKRIVNDLPLLTGTPNS
jgi:two-component system chemotaxis response regulator CheV